MSLAASSSLSLSHQQVHNIIEHVLTVLTLQLITCCWIKTQDDIRTRQMSVWIIITGYHPAHETRA